MARSGHGTPAAPGRPADPLRLGTFLLVGASAPKIGRPDGG
jgi:hypothetical protein